MVIGLVELACSGENGSKLWSWEPAPCCELFVVKSESWHSCDVDMLATVTLTPSYSQSVSMVESTGSKSEIAKFCMMEDSFSSSVSTARTWWICASVSIRS